MGRFTDREDFERYGEEHPQTRMPLSQGRGGSGTSGETEQDRREKPHPARVRGGGGDLQAQLRAVIDDATAGEPTMSEFVKRLEQRGVHAIPSMQTSGRLNGMVYRFQGQNTKGAMLGREYTAHGLQQQKGVSYLPERDKETLVQAAEAAGLHRAEPRHLHREQTADSARDRASRVRDRESGLSADQKQTLAEIGKFRTVNAPDLVRYRYGGDGGRFQQDLHQLVAKQLVQRRTLDHTKTGTKYAVVVLTERGRKTASMLSKSDAGSSREQQFHAGLVKPAEVRHDVGLYRMYQVEAERIQHDGGTVKRVILDYELKRKVFSELNKDQHAPALLHASRKEEIAGENGLQVVNGRVVFPDLRIEFESRDGEQEKVDLELATGDYKNSEVATKRAAGLKIYGPNSAPRSPALQDPEIVAGLISF